MNNENYSFPLVKKYVELMMNNSLFQLIFPEDKTEESAEQLLKALGSPACGIAKFIEKDQNGIDKYTYGVLIDTFSMSKGIKQREGKNNVSM